MYRYVKIIPVHTPVYKHEIIVKASMPVNFLVKQFDISSGHRLGINVFPVIILEYIQNLTILILKDFW